MFKNFFFTIFLSLFFVSFLEASNEKINQQLFELKTSQDYAQKINDEKLTLIMGQIIQKENEIKELENKIDELRKDKNSLENYKNIIERQDKRIEDIHSNLNYWSIGFSIIAILTGLVVFLVNRSYAESAKKEAKMAAKKELEMWVNKKADEEFKPIVDSYLAQIRAKADKKFDKYDDIFSKLILKYFETNKKEMNKDNKKINSLLNSIINNEYTNEEQIQNIDDIINYSDGKYTNELLVLKAFLLKDSQSEKALSIINTIIHFLENKNEKKKLTIKVYAYIVKALILGYKEKKQIKEIVLKLKELSKNLDEDIRLDVEEYIDIFEKHNISIEEN